MKRDDLIRVLAVGIPIDLAEHLVDEFLQLRHDVATGTLGRASAGKFVETLVQILQHLESGTFDPQPNVDKYLRSLDSQTTALDDDLRICAGRIARAVYSLRNKRNIVHKGSVAPNQYDLSFCLHAAQWIVAELVRLIMGTSMAAAGDLIAQIQAPVGTLVEDFGGRRLVLRDLATRDELLVLLHSHYPSAVETTAILASMDRRNPKTVRNSLRALWVGRLIEGDNTHGYRLTQTGFGEAANLIAGHLD